MRRAVRSTSFAALPAGTVGLVLDSYGMLAVALDQRSAADELGLAPGVRAAAVVKSTNVIVELEDHQ